MNSVKRAAHLGLAGIAVVMLAACGTDGQAASPGNTIARLDTPNFATIPPVTTPPPTEAPPSTVADDGRSSESQSYTIQSGDSLSKIAGQFEVSMDDIVQFNGWSDGIDHFLYPGDVIEIPPNAAIAGSSTSDAAESESDSGTDSASADDDSADDADDGEGCTYTIEAGDFPGRVAEDFGISFNILNEANPEHDFNTWFTAGNTIKIPPGADCP